MTKVKQSTINACARAAHETNKSYCEAIGDNSQLSWEDAPDWQRYSALNGVRGALSGNTPEQSHAQWLDEKLASGWKYGPVKDPSAKEHPCMVAYSELPPEQRAKDSLFLSVVAAVARALERIAKELCRVPRCVSCKRPVGPGCRTDSLAGHRTGDCACDNPELGTYYEQAEQMIDTKRLRAVAEAATDDDMGEHYITFDRSTVLALLDALDDAQGIARRAQEVLGSTRARLRPEDAATIAGWRDEQSTPP